MRVTWRVRTVLLVVVAALVAAGCGGDDSESDSASSTSAVESGGEATTTTATPKSGGVITMGTYTEPSGLDPVVAQGGGTSGNHEMGAIYGTLMRYDTETRALRAVDGRVADRQRRQHRVDAQAAAERDVHRRHARTTPRPSSSRSSATRSTARPWRRSSARSRSTPSSTRATVKITLTTSWPNFPYVLSHTPGMIPSKAAIEAACPDATKPARDCGFNLAPVGAGPFKVDSYTPKESIVLTRNDDYWAGPVHLDGVKFVTLRGGELTYESVKTDELQVGFIREPAAIAKVNEEAETQIYTNTQGLGGIALLNNGQVTCKNKLPAAICARTSPTASSTSTSRPATCACVRRSPRRSTPT